MRPFEHKTYDCAPTLNDTQVLDFCKNGYLLLEGVVSEEVNHLSVEYCDKDDFYEPTGILAEDWFHEGVICNPVAAGAVDWTAKKFYATDVGWVYAKVRELMPGAPEDVVISCAELLAYLVLATRPREIRLVRAGHNAPLLYSARHGQVIALHPKGIAVGLLLLGYLVHTRRRSAPVKSPDN